MISNRNSDTSPGVLMRPILQKEVRCRSAALEALGVKPLQMTSRWKQQALPTSHQGALGIAQLSICILL